MRSLTSIIYKNSKRQSGENSKKTIILGGLAFGIVFFALALVMVYFSYKVTTMLEEINQSYAFVNILLLMNFMILFMKSIFESLNVLYFSKDLKILLRMPIKEFDIINAKMINMIISEYQMEIIMIAIPMIVYGIIVNAGFMFYLYMVAILLVLPIIPIIITSVIIAIIMRFTNFVKDKSKVMYITIIFSMFIIGLITMNFNSQSDFSVSAFENIILKANGLAESISDSFVLVKPIMNTLLNYNNIDGIVNFIIYIAENVICYFLGVLFISKIYLKGAIGTTINSKKIDKKVDAKLTIDDFKESSIKDSYIKKEKLTIRRSPIFFIQCTIMPIIYPIVILVVIVGFLMFAKLTGVDLWEKFYEISITSFGAAIFIGVGQVFFMMNFNSIISVSKDSSYAKLIKYIPIDLNKQFNFKLKLGSRINTISIIILTVSYGICTKNILESIIILLILEILNRIGEKYKLLIDLRNPKLTWTSEYTMMKQNTNIMYVLFYTLIVIAIIFGISKIVVYSNFYLIIILGILFILNTLINEYIRKNKSEIFSKIY